VLAHAQKACVAYREKLFEYLSVKLNDQHLCSRPKGLAVHCNTIFSFVEKELPYGVAILFFIGNLLKIDEELQVKNKRLQISSSVDSREVCR